MSVDVTRLQVVLGMTDDLTFDTARATDIIAQAAQIIEPITGTPIPESADPIYLSVVTRAYLNPTNATQLVAGPYTASLPSGGVYLLRAERGALQRAVGRGNHFVIEQLPYPYRSDS